MLMPSMRYRGNNICRDERTNEADRIDSPETCLWWHYHLWQRHKKTKTRYGLWSTPTYGLL